MSQTSIPLESLCGLHTLSGVFMDSVKEDYCGDPTEKQVMRFTLDGKHYEAVESPSDGYRSSLERICITSIAPRASFKEIKVLGTMKPDTMYKNEILQLLSLNTGKPVLEVGTSNADDYYPGYVAEFHPENE